MLTTYEFLSEGRPVEICESWEPMAVTNGTPVVLPEAGPFKGAGVIERMRSIGVLVASSLEVPARRGRTSGRPICSASASAT